MSFPNPFGNLNDLINIAKDENFRKFLSNPKVQALMKDPEFEKAVKEKNMMKLMSNPEFMGVMKDPELRMALEQMQQKFKRPS